MARVFTTSFDFNHQRYDAIITVTMQNDQLSFQVRLLDVDFHHLIPNGLVVYNGDSGFEQLETLNNTVAQSLMRKIDEAIRKHLVTT